MFSKNICRIVNHNPPPSRHPKHSRLGSLFLPHPQVYCVGISALMRMDRCTYVPTKHGASGTTIKKKVWFSLSVSICGSITPGITVLHALICARSSEYRPERGLQARIGKYCIISDPRAGPAGHESGRRASTCTFAQSKDGSAGQIRESDPRVSRKQLAGYGAVNCPTSRLGIYILLARY